VRAAVAAMRRPVPPVGAAPPSVWLSAWLGGGAPEITHSKLRNVARRLRLVLCAGFDGTGRRGRAADASIPLNRRRGPGLDFLFSAMDALGTVFSRYRRLPCELA
jgi:hypothetical protein